MKTMRAWLMRLLGVFGSTRAERELSAEIESHLQLHIDDNLRAGMSPQEARRRAVLALGGVERTKEEYRDRRGLPAFESLVRDLRYGTRGLIKSPGFALAAVIILGLGIGANSAIFTVVNAVVLKPLPFADADRVMRLWQTPPQSLFTTPIFAISPANFVDWQEQNQVFERVAIFRTGRQTLTGHGEPDAVIILRASADFLPILGLSPAIGRGFTTDDDRSGGERTALLSDAFFRTRFGGDAAIVGKTITLNRVPHTVIGILPPMTTFGSRAQVWVPLYWTAEDRAIRNNHNYSAIAKLKNGVDVARAQADMDAISKRLEAAYPEDNKDWGALVRPLQEDLVGDARTSLLVLLGAVAFVLLIACANLANLMLVRTHARAKEIAVRGALGASRTRVIQQLLAEGLVLGAGGGMAGFIAAYYGVDVLLTAFGTALPRATEVAVDTRVLIFTAAIAMATGLVAAFVPAWKMTGRDANDALKTGAGRGNSSSGDGRIRNLLVVSEVALALMLLIGAGLLMRSLSGLRAVDAGFDPGNTLTATIGIPDAKYPTEAERNQFFDRVIANVEALPGVESAAFIDNLPLQGGSTQYVAVEGAPPMKESEMPVVAVRLTSPGYFKTSKIPFIAGRDFTDADNGFGRPAVVIISEGTAKRFWPNQDAIGKRLTLTMMTKEAAAVVGIVREVKTGSLDASDADSETAVYAPRAQFGYGGTAIVVRTAGDPARMTPSLINAVRSIDPEQPVLDIATMDDVVEESLGQRPFAMMLLAAFAILALVLATVGIYSVLAYTVRQRVREIGIRMALGAPTGGVLRLIVIEGLKPTLAGVLLGLALAAALVRVMTTLLYGVDQHDPGTFSAVAVIMLVVGVVATLVPAFRATRVDPIVTLRSE
jgi:putative ABC transport system permease protein